ncbi:hypothetical protein EYR41_000230 [Orbilia oligospora]|uniref:Uncharacterized protein n=1 Tax=Orbilia oligospora TaxID=2813651 RepID=A0A8H2HYB7_ORBOL|nr:hypothetical protein EYR41_000230 [Orbilia oligospora]
MLLELISVPSGQFLLLALYLWLSCFDFVSARRKTPTAAANQDNPPWYHPPDFYVTAQECDDFIKPRKDHNYLEDPVWYIFHGGYILRDFSRQQEMLATILANYTGDNTWLDFRTQYFRIIAPLTMEWYPIGSEVDGYPKNMQNECRVARRKLKNSYKEKIETHLTIDIPPGIMDCGGSMDTSAERDGSRKGNSKLDPPEWLFQFPGQKHFPFPRDSISIRGMLKDLFNATPQIDKNTGEVMVGVSQAERQRQTRIFRREKIGYEEYFNLKFGGTLSETTDRVTDSEWINPAALMYSYLEKGAHDLLVTYGNIINIVYRGLLPLIMDMMADISVRENDLAVEHAE